MENQTYWRRCSICKEEIPFSHKYYLCSVSSCTKKRAPVQFCSVSCWDSHNAVMNHMNAGADEYTSPSKQQWLAENQEAPRRRIVVENKSNQPTASSSNDEILVVVSKLKAYIQCQSSMSTSADVMPLLSGFLRREADKAIENARRAGRKTVMARDFQ